MERQDHQGGSGRGASGLMALAIALVLLVHVSGCGTTPVGDASRGSTAASKKKFSSKTSWYRVKKGDTLYAVSWRAGVDWKTLARWNGLKSPYTIYPGQLLRLKAPATTVSRKSVSSRPKGGRKTATTRRSNRAAPSTGSRSGSTSAKKKPAATTGRLHWQWPVKGRIISRFSKTDPDLDGIKIAGSPGRKIKAAESGTVVYTGSGLIGYGELIIIKHNNEFLSAYGHNSRLYVKEGQQVKKGQHISDMGSNSAGQYLLHFEIRRYGKPVDPLAYLPHG